MNLRNVVRHSAFPFALLGALGFVLCLNLAVAVAHQHHENKVYDKNGWSEVADRWTGKFTWGIDPDFPTLNDDGYNIREAMRDGMAAWGMLRTNRSSEGYAREVNFASAGYQYIECEGENLCYGSNVKQLHDGVSVCSSNHWGLDGHGPICYAYSKLDPSWDAPNGELSFRGAILHEMGHALGLQHPSWTTCNTVMNGCWAYRDNPGVPDEKSLDRIYGLPYDPSASVVSGTTIKGQAKDYSSYDQHYRFELWKKPSGSTAWTFIHSNTATAPGTHGQIVSYSENVGSEGCGEFTYGIWAVNDYPDDTETDQFGGYTNSIYVCDVP